MVLKNGWVDMYFESIFTMRKNRISWTCGQFLRKSRTFDIAAVSQAIESIAEGHRLRQSFLYSRLERREDESLTVYHKSLYKLENQYCFVTLYKIRKIGLI